jgi:hypothetical protein
MHIVLFTPFHPDFGGGATYFHSTLAALDGIRVTWAYLGQPTSRQPNTLCLGPALTGGSLLPDLCRTARLWITGSLGTRTQRIVDQLLSLQPDGYWIVPMHEAIPLANELHSRIATPIHLSVQDDQCDAIAARSRRYRHLMPWMRRRWLQLMRSARSIDACSTGMRERYATAYDLTSNVFHPYIPALPRWEDQQAAEPTDKALIVGHIGSIYSPQEWLAFVSAFKSAAAHLQRRPQLRLIGPSGIPLQKTCDLLGTEQVEVIPYQHGDAALPLLHGCHFLYAMYPFAHRDQVFRQTSLPSKLAVYLRAQRPVFAHTPADSTLSRRIAESGIGTVCSSLEQAKIREQIQELATQPAPDPQQYEATRERFYGIRNVQLIQTSLTALATAA